MNPYLFILVVAWTMLISYAVPKFIKDEALRDGVKMMLHSMSLGVYIGMFIAILSK
jgi:hypothetical protein